MSKNKPRHEKVVLLVIMLSAFWLRNHSLTSESIWFDEGYTLLLSDLTWVEIVDKLIVDYHPPVHFLALQFWVKFLNNTAFSLRWFSVIASMLTVPFTYQLGRCLWNRQVGLIAAALVSLSSFHIYYAQEARMYAIMGLLIVASMYIFIQLLRAPTIALSLTFLVTTMLLLYTHLFSSFYVLVQGVVVLIYLLFISQNKLVDFRRWLFIGSSIIIGFLPWLVIAIPQVQRVNTGDWIWITAPTIMTLVRIIGRFSGSIPLLLIALLLVALSIYHLWRLRDQHLIAGSLLLLWLILPIAIPYIISTISAPILVTRYTLGASLAFYLIVAYAIFKMPRQEKQFISLLWIALSLFSCYQYFETDNKAPWQSVIEDVSMLAGQDDLIVLNDEVTQRIFQLYQTNPAINTVEFPAGIVDCCISAENAPSLVQLIAPYERVWLIRNKKDDLDVVETTLSPMYHFIDFNSYTSKYDNGLILIELEKKR